MSVASNTFTEDTLTVYWKGTLPKNPSADERLQHKARRLFQPPLQSLWNAVSDESIAREEGQHLLANVIASLAAAYGKESPSRQVCEQLAHTMVDQLFYIKAGAICLHPLFLAPIPSVSVAHATCTALPPYPNFEQIIQEMSVLQQREYDSFQEIAAPNKLKPDHTLAELLEAANITDRIITDHENPYVPPCREIIITGVDTAQTVAIHQALYPFFVKDEGAQHRTCTMQLNDNVLTIRSPGPRLGGCIERRGLVIAIDKSCGSTFPVSKSSGGIVSSVIKGLGFGVLALTSQCSPQPHAQEAATAPTPRISQAQSSQTVAPPIPKVLMAKGEK